MSTTDTAIKADAAVDAPTESDAGEGLMSADANPVGSYAVQTANKIARMIARKFLKDGDRNFLIGAETWGYLLTLRKAFDKFTPQDFDKQISDISTYVRALVSIDAKSIRLMSWVSSHVLRELCRAEIGDLADKLSYYEYEQLTFRSKETKSLRALALDKKNVSAGLTEGWLAFVRTIAEERATGGDISPDEFRERLTAFDAEQAELRASADPARAETEKRLAALKEQAKKVNRVTRSVNESLTEAISSGIMTGESVANLLASVCKGLKQPMPRLIGYDPATASEDELKAFVAVMVTHKRVAELRSLHTLLGRVVEGMDRAAAGKASVSETLKIKAG